jgi:hypothetical protein
LCVAAEIHRRGIAHGMDNGTQIIKEKITENTIDARRKTLMQAEESSVVE